MGKNIRICKKNMELLMLMFRIFLYIEKPSTRGAWSLVEGVPTTQPAYNFSWQLNYSTVGPLFQVILEKGGLTMWIFRAWITAKDGTRIYAKDHGKRAFRFWVGPGPEPAKRN